MPARRLSARLQVRAAVRQARRFGREHPAAVRVCWDLDNTIVDSGVLLRAGRSLDEAIVEAYPVANMLAFYDALSSRLPGAAHFVLTARRRSMRAATIAWCERHGLDAREASLCLLPHPAAKPRVWRELAHDARLVIVDDLSFNHELDEPNLYDELIDAARRTARGYVGFDEIARIAANPAAAEQVAAATAAAVASA